jgi:hypothetical protein
MTMTLYPASAGSTESSLAAPWYMQVARGLVPGCSVVNVYGYTAAAPVSPNYGAVWEGGATAYAYPSSAGVPAYASTSSETVTMTVSGLDSTYAAVTDTVTFSGGTTGTATIGQSFYRINSMRLATGANVGTITAKISGTTYAQINPGGGQTQMSIYTVPLGYTFYLTRSQAYANNNGSQFTTYRVLTNVYGTGPQIALLNSPFDASYTTLRVAPRGYAQKTDIQWQVSNSTSGNAVGVQVEGILISNTAA